MAEHFRGEGGAAGGAPIPADAYGALLFWTNLLFYVVMYGGILVMVIGRGLLVRDLFRAQDHTYAERASKLRILLLSRARSCSSFLIGGVYTAVMYTWENMTRGLPSAVRRSVVSGFLWLTGVLRQRAGRNRKTRDFL